MLMLKHEHDGLGVGCNTARDSGVCSKYICGCGDEGLERPTQLFFRWHVVVSLSSSPHPSHNCGLLFVFHSGWIPAEFGRLVALKRLDMSYNRLTGKCGKDCFEHVSLLRLERKKWRQKIRLQHRSLSCLGGDKPGIYTNYNGTSYWPDPTRTICSAL